MQKQDMQDINENVKRNFRHPNQPKFIVVDFFGMIIYNLKKGG